LESREELRTIDAECVSEENFRVEPRGSASGRVKLKRRRAQKLGDALQLHL
jgi:hypothetical protein